MSIRYSDVVACSIDVLGDVDIFRFPGTAGETVTVRSSKFSGGANTAPCVELFDPMGTSVGSDCFAQGARLEAGLGLTGTYSVLVSEFANDNTMDYSVLVERVAPPSPWARYICPGCSLQGSIDPFGDIDLFFFVGTSGDSVSILGTKLAGGVNTIPCVELFDPAGGLVDSDCFTQGAQINATLGLTGSHSIVVSEFPNDNTMDYNLSYQCIVGACVDIGRIMFADGFESGDTTAWSGSVP